MLPGAITRVLLGGFFLLFFLLLFFLMLCFLVLNVLSQPILCTAYVMGLVDTPGPQRRPEGRQIRLRLTAACRPGGNVPESDPLTELPSPDTAEIILQGRVSGGSVSDVDQRLCDKDMGRLGHGCH